MLVPAMHARKAPLTEAELDRLAMRLCIWAIIGGILLIIIDLVVWPV